MILFYSRDQATRITRNSIVVRESRVSKLLTLSNAKLTSWIFARDYKLAQKSNFPQMGSRWICWYEQRKLIQIYDKYVRVGRKKFFSSPPKLPILPILSRTRNESNVVYYTSTLCFKLFKSQILLCCLGFDFVLILFSEVISDDGVWYFLLFWL